AVTPFVLSYLHEQSGGRTLEVNRDLVVANAGLAARVAASPASSPQGQATPRHWAAFPLWCAVFPCPSMFPAAAKMPRSPFRFAWLRLMVLPESAASIPSSPFPWVELLTSMFPVEPENAWMPSMVLPRTQFRRSVLFVVLNNSMPMWFRKTVLLAIRMFVAWKGSIPAMLFRETRL